MYICNCHAVTDKKLEQLLENGCSSIKAIQKSCEAGKDCGACILQINEMLNNKKHNKKKVTAKAG